jgi:cytochrome c peroxidase
MRIRGLGAKRVVLLGALAVALAGVSLGATILVGALGTKDELSATRLREGRSASPRIGNVRALQASYEQWKAQQAATEGDRMLVLPLAYTKGLSARFTNAHGQARLDLTDGTIAVEVSGLPTKETFDVWLVDNRPGPGQSVRPEPGDHLLRVGRLEPAGEARALRERLGRELLISFKLDLIVVAPAGGDPGADGLLFAAPSLFHRLYYSEQPTTVVATGGKTGTAWSPFSVLVPRPAWAQASGAIDLQVMVEQGRQLFFEQTFQGNGRTCGTCHDAENNLTIDPAFIARLPKSDPLFVAETQDALKCEDPQAFTGCKFEHPGLMRKFGLILENVDGFPNPGVMRGVPHTLAMRNSLGVNGNAIGWSRDGAPAPGTLRQFAIGAVTQHFTRSLNRVAGVDFRLPSPAELDAMEAFQFSLGRQTDPNLPSMVFQSSAIEEGKNLFITQGCNACHANAGAKVGFGAEPRDNRNFDTGVENLLTASQRRDAKGNVIRPRDGGLGSAAGTDADGFTFFGDGTFNTPVALEGAFKKTFFHNNAVTTLEEAVAFYISDTFDASPQGPALELTTAQVDLVAKFLRVLGAREKIRSATATLHNARESDFEDAKALLEFSISEDGHAVRVLNARGLHRDAVGRLRLAQLASLAASRTRVPTLRGALIDQAITLHKAACGNLVQEASCADLEP